MINRYHLVSLLFMLGILLNAGCTTINERPPTEGMRTPSEAPTSKPTVNPFGDQVSFSPGEPYEGINLISGADSNTEKITLPDSARAAIRSGSGSALSANDANQTEDSYIQFEINDNFLFDASPTSRVIFIIEYLDEGADTFNIQYDALSGGPFGDGKFKNSAKINKTGTGEIKTVELIVCDANFANRNNGTDFRISDFGDGAETILSLSIQRLASTSGPREINVDSCGADPFDDQADSSAIQTCLAMACSGDTILFTSGVEASNYRGYLIDKTIFLSYPSEKSDLTFTSTDPDNHALLQATADLKGFVVQLRARSLTNSPGLIDNITLTHLDIDGNKSERVCTGVALPGQNRPIGEGENDNWGSWLPECSPESAGDPWCNPGTLYLAGGLETSDPEQDYLRNPGFWSTGFIVQDVNLSNAECGTAFFFSGADFRIDSVTIDSAGEHTHAPGCQPDDQDEDPIGAWADGITFLGPAHQLTKNLIIDPSDVGIVSFGGRDILIADNTIWARAGNHGMFAGIAMHPNTLGLITNLQVTGNQIINDADQTCGGVHIGINLGVHTWANGCMGNPTPATYGVAEDCSVSSPPPLGALCETNTYCRTWGHIAPDGSLTLRDNIVSGAQTSFVISGLDVLGELVISGNESADPQMVDWEFDAYCVWAEAPPESWGVLDFAAFNPALEGWVEQQIYCAR